MFVRPVIEARVSRSDGVEIAGNRRGFHTANELFDIMARRHNFQPDGENRLTTRDLVILYENLDLGNKLMSRANELNTNKSNQYVENIVCKDCDSDSEDSDLCCTEDILNFLIISKERINQMKHSSTENTLCSKFSDTNIKALHSNFGHRNQRISDQFKVTNDIFAVPPSLFDYLRNKGNDSNCELYMDNIIRHVQLTIDQLKRISNGEYLTEKVKEKWLETRKDIESVENNKENIMEVPSKLPITMEKQSFKFESSWNDVMRSEIDIRCIYKLLDHKVYLEMPTAISGKIYNDSLVIGFKRESPTALREQPEQKKRLEVVFNVTKSEEGFIFETINSITVLQNQDIKESKFLSLPCNDQDTEERKEKSDVIINEPKLNSDANQEIGNEKGHKEEKEYKKYNENLLENLKDDDDNCNNSTLEYEFTKTAKIPQLNINDLNDRDLDQESIEESTMLNDELESEPCCYYHSHASTVSNNEQRGTIVIISETSIEIPDEDDASNKPPDASTIPNELSLNGHDIIVDRLNMPIPLPEEIPENLLNDVKYLLSDTKKAKSSKKGKPPYETAYNEVQEKRRKKLLEIKERRERKRKELLENSKLKKAKHSVPQGSNSVTKLSITNKAFYNSIYGQERLNHIGSDNTRKLKMHHSEISNSNLLINSDSDSEFDVFNANKYSIIDIIDDDLQTESSDLRLENVHNNVDNNFNAEPNLSPCTSVGVKQTRKTTNTDSSLKLTKNIQPRSGRRSPKKHVKISPSTNLIPKTHKNSLKAYNTNKSLPLKESIDKIYNLMGSNAKQSENISSIRTVKSNVPYSDSGTSLKHKQDLENPSNFSFDKPLSEKVVHPQKLSSAIEPKVIITAKTHKKINDDEKKKKKPVIDNPLKAISQLLHDIDYVQKTRIKSGDQNNYLHSIKSTRATATSQQNVKESIIYVDKIKTRKPKLEQLHIPTSSTNVNSKSSPKNPPTSAKSILRVPKKKVAEIVDELKEARGEAVRGPSLWNPRLNSLAQPRKAYLQATIQQCEARNAAKKTVPQRLQRMIETYSYQVKKQEMSSMKKPKIGYERVSKDDSVRKVPPPTPEREAKITRSKDASLKENPLIRMRKTTESSAQEHNNQKPTLPRRKPFGDVQTKLVMLGNKVAQDESQKGQALQSEPERDGKTTRSNESLSPTTDNKFETEKYVVEKSRKMAAVESYVQNHYQQSPASPKRKVLSVDMRVGSLSNKTVEQTMSLSSVSEETAADEILNSKKANIVSSTKITSANNEYSEVVAGDKGHVANKIKNNSEETFSNRGQLTESGNLKNSMNIYVNITSTKINEETNNFRVEEIANLEAQHPHGGYLKKHLSLGFFPFKSKDSFHKLILLQATKKIHNLGKSTSYQFINAESQSLLNNLDWNLKAFPIQIPTYAYSLPVTQKLYTKKGIQNSVGKETYQNTSDLVWPLRESAAQIFNKNHNLMSLSHTAVKGTPLECINSELVISLKTESVNQHKNTYKENTFTEKIKINNVIRSVEMKKETNKNDNLNEKHIENTNETCDTKRFNKKLNNTAKVEKSKTDLQNSEFTSSLDILAELLDEIQKITVCQTQIANSETEIECEKIPKVAEEIESCKLITIATVDKLRFMESSSTVISTCIASERQNVIKESITNEYINVHETVNKSAPFEKNNSGILIPVVNMYEKNITTENDYEKSFKNINDNLEVPICTIENPKEVLDQKKEVIGDKIKFEKKEIPANLNKYLDKEITVVELINKQDKATNKPSDEPLNIDNTFLISNSALGILSQPSGTEDSSDSTPLVIKNEKKLKEENFLFTPNKKMNDIVTIKEYVNINKYSPEDKEMKMVPALCHKIDTEEVQLTEDKDLQFQMKRNILVTVYSFLVFAVFSALSFPDMMNLN